MLVITPKALAYDFTLGSTVEPRPYADTYHNFSIVDVNKPASDGFITRFNYWANNTNPFKFLIVDGTKKVVWKSDLITPAEIGMSNYIPSIPAEIKVGWYVGMYFQETGTIPFEYNVAAEPAYYTPNDDGEPAIGETLNPQGTNDRYYSFVALGWKDIPDDDRDGVYNETDLCNNTEDNDTNWDSDKGLGTNRWQVRDKIWYQNRPVTQGKGTAEVMGQSIGYTYGCNGHQIIDMLRKELGENAMMGHYKFGLSTSVLEEFHNDFMDDRVLDGKYFIGTYNVPATNRTGITTGFSTITGVDYILEASGRFKFANWGEYGYADAEWMSRDAAHTIAPNPAGWQNPIPDNYPCGADVKINNTCIDWGIYNPDHKYVYTYVGTGIPLSFSIYDDYYNDNSGFIYIDIYADL